MKLWKTIVMLLLVCGMASGCGKSARDAGDQEKEQIHLIVKTPALTMSYNDEITESYDLLKLALDRFAEQYDKADITYDLVRFAYTDVEEYIEGTFDTEDAADIFFEGYFNMATYIHTGRVVPLDDIITDELRSDIDQVIWNQGVIDGRTYMMPYYTLQNTLCYSKELFRQAGLDQYVTDEEVIQSWTLEEWEEILSTLREELPPLVYPMMMYAKNNQGDTHIMTLLRSHGSSIFDENHNFHLNTEEGIAALTWIKDCYDAGYYPIGAENLEISETTMLRENGQLAIGHINNTKAKPEFGLVNYPSVDGKGYATSFVYGFEVFDNGDESRVQAAKDFLTFFYSQDDLMDVSTCGLPVSSAVFERHAGDIYMLKAYQNNVGNVVDFMENNPNWLGVRDRFYTHIYDLLTGERTPEQVAADLDADCNAAIEEGRKNSKLWGMTP